MLLKLKKHPNLKYLASSDIFSHSFNIVTQSKTHTFLMVKRYLYHVCCHGNHCAIRTTLILKTRYAFCIACFIKQFVNSCLLHGLCSSIDVKLQETHKITKIWVLPFNYSDLKTLASSTSKRHQQFYDVMFRLHQLHTFQRLYLCYL